MLVICLKLGRGGRIIGLGRELDAAVNSFIGSKCFIIERERSVLACLQTFCVLIERKSYHDERSKSD